jgi:very-short-patch-repair endonuclease
MFNKIFIDGEEAKETRKEGRSRVWELETGEVVENKNVDEYGIKCFGCDKVNTVSQLVKSRHLDQEYFCQSCGKKGENNPFYGKTHDEESKKKIGGAADHVDYSGGNNPMYGENPYEKMVKKYGEKKADEMWRQIKESKSEAMSGENNPFYGKTHDDEAVEKIIEANKRYQESLDVWDRLDWLEITKQDLEEMYEFYKSDRGSRESFNEKFDICHRTACKYWLKTGIAENLGELKSVKKIGGSAKEERLYKKLRREFGDEVERQHKINGYAYDFLIGSELIVELDGYYWHQVVENENDEKKERLAKQNGYRVYRVKESEDRNVEYESEIKRIKELYYGTQKD